MSIKISTYNAICNLGKNIEEIYDNAIFGNDKCFVSDKNFAEKIKLRIAKIQTELPEIADKKYNLRCNRLILSVLKLIEQDLASLFSRYSKNDIAIIAATTNSGVNEYEKTQNIYHSELGNPAIFTKKYLSLNNFCTTVSTACSSGIKAFSTARDLLNKDISKAVIVIGVDSIAKVPLYGFNSLEILTERATNPFSKNRDGINIGEAVSVFILEKNTQNGIEILGIGETSDIYHATTPDPEAKEAIAAMKNALKEANINPQDADYINLHGTGTIANDLMEATAISKVFGNKIPTSSTKPLTGHCLGAAASIESALCCKLLDNFNGLLYPHIYDEQYDNKLPKIKLVKKNEKYNKCKICICNSFGFGGSNAILILGARNEQ